jgi:pimeloyl-ACP methyl ester carboxylesterase
MLLEQEITVTLQRRTVAVNGVNLHVIQAGPEDGELVILLHGFPEFWYGWREQIPALALAGYRVWVPDQRGYNLSEKPKGLKNYTLDVLTKDVIDLITVARREKAYLVGHDWGGIVAWWTAMTHPKRLKKLAILNAPHPSVARKQMTTNPGQMLKSAYFGLFQIPWLPEKIMLREGAAVARTLFTATATRNAFSDEDIAEYRRAWQAPGAATGMLNWYRAVVQRGTPKLNSSRVHVPTLLMWGVNDAALSREMAPESLRYCDDGRLVWFEKATHWVQHDEPLRVSELLVEHFSS